MSQLVKNRLNRLLDNAIAVVGTKKIMPAVVLNQLGRMSAYIEHIICILPE